MVSLKEKKKKESNPIRTGVFSKIRRTVHATEQKKSVCMYSGTLFNFSFFFFFLESYLCALKKKQILKTFFSAKKKKKKKKSH